MPGKTEIIIGKNGVIKATGFGKPPHLAPHTKDFGVGAREK